jgi:hypothetical protein
MVELLQRNIPGYTAIDAAPAAFGRYEDYE